jgi:hemerythrin
MTEKFEQIKNELIEYFKENGHIDLHPQMVEIFLDCINISAAKNRDYCGQNTNNPFKNFELTENISICPTEKGIMVRICDKIARISNLLNNKNMEGEVKDEKIEDTLKDLINYAAILLVYIQNKK